MNYRDYRAIMQAEALQESELVRVFLSQAKKQQRFLKRLAACNWQDTRAYRLTKKRKVMAIWDAIEAARHEKLLGYQVVEEGREKVAAYLQETTVDFLDSF